MAIGVPLKQHPGHGYPCDEDECGETSCTDGVVHKALDGKVAEGVDEGQEGGCVERLAAEVEGTQEAQRARQQSPHRNRSPMYSGHWYLRVGARAERRGTEEAGPGEGGAEGSDSDEPPPQRRHAALVPCSGHGLRTCLAQ